MEPKSKNLQISPCPDQWRCQYIEYDGRERARSDRPGRTMQTRNKGLQKVEHIRELWGVSASALVLLFER